MSEGSEAILDYGQQPLSLFLDLRGGWCADIHLKSGAFVPAADYDQVLDRAQHGKIDRLGLKWFDGEVASEYIPGGPGTSTTAAIVGTVRDLRELTTDLYANATFRAKLVDVGHVEPEKRVFDTICDMIGRVCLGRSDDAKAYIAIASAIHHVNTPENAGLLVVSGPKGISRVVAANSPYFGIDNLAPLHLTGTKEDGRLAQVDRVTETVYWHPDFGQAILTQGGRGLEAANEMRLEQIRAGHAYSAQEQDGVKHQNQTIMRKTTFVWIGVIDEVAGHALMLDNFMRPDRDQLRTSVIGFNHYNKIGLHHKLQPDIWAAFEAAARLDKVPADLRKVADEKRKSAPFVPDRLRDEFDENGDPGERVTKLVTKLIATMSSDEVRRLHKMIIDAQSSPPANKQQFVNDVNRLLDVFNLRIYTERGPLRLTLKNGSLQLVGAVAGSTGSFARASILGVRPVPVGYVGRGQNDHQLAK